MIFPCYRELTINVDLYIHTLKQLTELKSYLHCIKKHKL